MNDPVSLTRNQLRAQLRAARRALSPRQQRAAARALYRHLAQHPAFRRARCVAFYLPNDGEIDPRLLLYEAQRRKKLTFLPVLETWPRTRMAFQRVRPGEPLVRNRFGIAEPAPVRSRQRRAWSLDLVCLPLVGFDERGGRLGMGGGFYDRSLAYLKRRRIWCRPALLGLAHDCQKVEHLSLASWDVPLRATVTDRAVYTGAAAPGR